jgi:alginate O-acetyltransferase complex protein AlgI
VNYTDSLFIFTFAAIVVVARALRPWPLIRQWFLTIFSLFVIMTWGIYSLVLFLVIAGANFFAARLVTSRSKLKARLVLGVAVISDLAALAVFKYSKFLDLDLTWLTGAIGIPLAISFYTFHIISYLVDIYRGKTVPMTFGRYLFYLSFFPHVVAGPIVRTWQLVPQLRATRKVKTDWAMGLHFLVTGFFLKSICADNIAGIIDPAWTSTLSTSDHWLVAFLYYCQIYGDFGGYSLMALGMARLLGFRLPANFRSPMRAATFQEFWRRWHITLSRWLRDYLYIPLGGSRTGFTAANLMITMLLGGLWHGAGWGFVIWGALHGAGLIAERIVTRRNGLVWWLLTQVCVMIAWVPFRLPDWQSAKTFLRGMISIGNSPSLPAIAFALVFTAPIVAHQFLPLLISRVGIKRLPIYLGIMTGVLLIADLSIVAPGKVFLYFSF